MNIKDPAVHAAARELARRRGVSLTEAVRQAVDEALQADRARRDHLPDRLAQIGLRYRSELDRLDLRPLTDDELYDARGLPR